LVVKWITEEEINLRVSMKDIMEAIESFYLEGTVDFKIPERMHLDDRDNTVLVMLSSLQFKPFYCSQDHG
jgi:ornithine cyclodeaminase/alanine dehydrogenase-like protein (mu-crystallin family)